MPNPPKHKCDKKVKTIDRGPVDPKTKKRRVHITYHCSICGDWNGEDYSWE